MPVSLEEQEESVVSLLGLIDSANLGKDAITYSTLIDGLLKVHKNVLGANLVFDAMVKREVKIRPHVWTSFLTYFFQEANDGRGSPNFAAIEALWNRIQSTDGIIDVIFYDRMIEGYARYGEVDQALHFLTRMAKEARKPGWPCITAVVSALLDKGLVDKASEIVHDVEHSEGYFPHGIGLDHKKANPDRNMFWQVVVQAGLREMPPGLMQERDVNEEI
jgi:pentatricopeptide repeat protein